MTRGEQKPLCFNDIKIAKSTNQLDVKKARFAGDTINFESSFLIEKGAPEPKIAKFEVLLIKNKSDSRHTVIGQGETNISLNFGQQFQQGTVKITQTIYGT